MRRAWIWIAVVVAALYAAGCGASGGSESSDGGSSVDKVQAVATISVIQDLVRGVGGSRVEVSAIVPPGSSVETFQPSPSDAQKISRAEVVFKNGLGLEEWMGDLLESAGGENASVVELAEGLETLEDDNPHLWLDVENAESYVRKIRDALVEVDPEGAGTYRANAEKYLAELEELDRYIREKARSIPQERRKLVTFHDAFPYFAEAYGFEMVGVVLQNPDAEPSSREVVELVREIEEQDVLAIFTEPQFNQGLADTIAVEADVEVYELYSDALLDDPDADSYEDMMRANIDRIREGLTGE